MSRLRRPAVRPVCAGGRVSPVDVLTAPLLSGGGFWSRVFVGEVRAVAVAWARSTAASTPRARSGPLPRRRAGLPDSVCGPRRCAGRTPYPAAQWPDPAGNVRTGRRSAGAGAAAVSRERRTGDERDLLGPVVEVPGGPLLDPDPPHGAERAGAVSRTPASEGSRRADEGDWPAAAAAASDRSRRRRPPKAPARRGGGLLSGRARGVHGGRDCSGTSTGPHRQQQRRGSRPSP